MNIAKAIHAGLLAMSIIGVLNSSSSYIKTYNERVFGITDPTWVTNSRFDPSDDQIFRRAKPQGTWRMTQQEIEQEGLYGWYKS